MQLVDSSAITTYLVVVGIASVAAIALVVVTLCFALLETRRDRQARHESIPTYYGRLHFAG